MSPTDRAALDQRIAKLHALNEARTARRRPIDRALARALDRLELAEAVSRVTGGPHPVAERRAVENARSDLRQLEAFENVVRANFYAALRERSNVERKAFLDTLSVSDSNDMREQPQ